MSFDSGLSIFMSFFLIGFSIYIIFDIAKSRKRMKKLMGEMVEIKDLKSGEFQLIKPIKYNLSEGCVDGEFNGEYIGSYHPLHIMAFNDSKAGVEEEIKAKIICHAEWCGALPDGAKPADYFLRKIAKHISVIIEPANKPRIAPLPKADSVDWNKDLKDL